MWEQYPAQAELPQRIADLSLRDDVRTRTAAKQLEAEVRRTHLLAEDIFAGVYTSPSGKPVTVFGATGFRLDPKEDADEEMARLTKSYRLSEPQVVETGVRDRFARCAVGTWDGRGVVVCTSVDHGSIITAVFSQLSLADSARLLGTLREQIITQDQSAAS
jgi:hypothetical protein